MSEPDTHTESGLTRREILKRGAVLGGALVWGTPVVQVIGMRPAMAQSTSDTCPNLYCVKAEWDETTQTLGSFTACSAGHNRGKGNCLVTPGDVVPGLPSGSFVVSPTTCPELPDSSTLVPGIVVTLPSGCHLADIVDVTGSEDAFVGGVSAAAKCGSETQGLNCFAPTEVGEDSQGNTTLCFPIECPNGTSISHIEILLCCG